MKTSSRILVEVQQPPSLGWGWGLGRKALGWVGGASSLMDLLGTEAWEPTSPCRRTWLALPWAIAQHKSFLTAGGCKNCHTCPLAFSAFSVWCGICFSQLGLVVVPSLCP